MKLATQPVDIEKSADFKSIMMGIGNEVMIMEFLRNNLYSNKIGIVVQEYMSNARDAHREVGTPDRPIEVTLPSKLEPSFKVRDFGPGIDHDRMESAFAQYGISTKNMDDEATGGFGIGCMSGFSYSDTFTVVVVLPDRELPEFLDYYIEESGIDMDILIGDEWIPSNRTKRMYACYIDETRAGSIDLVDTVSTDEPVSTTIIVPCKRGDDREFRDQVIRVASWWDHIPNSARPIIKGGDYNFAWDKGTIAYEDQSNRWCILKKSQSYGIGPRDNPYVILDGIPYPLNLASIYPRRDMAEKSESIFDDEDEETDPIPDYARALFSVPLRLFFNTGELTVAVSREALDYGVKTREALRTKIKEIHVFINELIEERIADATNLWEACVAWKKIKNEFNFIAVAAEWKGMKLFEQLTVPTSDYHKVKERTCVYTYRWTHDDWSMDKNRTSPWHNTKINIADESIVLVEDDTDFTRPPKSKMRTVMLGIPEDERKDTVVKVVKFFKTTHRDQMEKDYNWSALNPIMLSTIEKTLKARPKVVRKPIKAKILRSGNYSFRSLSDGDVDFENGEGVFVAQYKGRYIADPENFRPKKDLDKCIIVDEDDLGSYCRRWDINIYCVLERYARKLGSGWQDLNSFMEGKLQKLANDPKIAHLFDIDPLYNADSHHASQDGLSIFWSNYDFGEDNQWLKSLNDPALKRWVSLSAEYWEHKGEIRWLRAEFETWGLPLKEMKSLKSLHNDIKERYGPALKYFHHAPRSLIGSKAEREQMKQEYYSYFVKYLNLIELEQRLGGK